MTPEEVQARLTPYSPERTRATDRAEVFGATAVDNGGTRALRALVQASLHTERLSDAWCVVVQESVERGLAHLRNVGLAHRVEHGVATLLGNGTHPFAEFVRELGARGVDVVFDAFESTSAYRGAVYRGYGRPELKLGIEALLELDPHGPVVVHERVHLETPAIVGSSPFVGLFAVGDAGGRLPGPPVWGYPRHQSADECHAHCKGLAADLRRAAAVCEGSDADPAATLHNVRSDIGIALAVTLRTVAVDKRTLGAIDDASIRWAEPSAGTLLIDQVGLAVSRGKSRFGVKFRSSFVLPLFEAIDSALVGGKGLSWLSRGFLRRHFTWQLRAASERLALLRVAAQAVDRALVDRAAAGALCSAAADVLTLERASRSSLVAPIGYAEALERFNTRFGATQAPARAPMPSLSLAHEGAELVR